MLSLIYGVVLLKELYSLSVTSGSQDGPGTPAIPCIIEDCKQYTVRTRVVGWFSSGNIELFRVFSIKEFIPPCPGKKKRTTCVTISKHTFGQMFSTQSTEADSSCCLQGQVSSCAVSFGVTQNTKVVEDVLGGSPASQAVSRLYLQSRDYREASPLLVYAVLEVEPRGFWAC